MLKQDVKFLSGKGLMDYSLLVAIETLKEDASKTRTESHASTAIHQLGAERLDEIIHDGEEYQRVEIVDVGELMSRKHCFVNGEVVYHFAIIDFL